jgi:hypothetical protein
VPPERAAVQKFKALMEQYKQPYTAAEAERFRQALRTRAFDNAAHRAAAPKRKTGLALGPSADEQQPDGLTKNESKARGAALIGQALQKKFDLTTKIAQSETEHSRDGGTMDVLFGMGRYIAFETGATFIPGPPKGWDGVIRKTMDFETSYKDDGKKNIGYQGNYSGMKDEVRMTLVCKNIAMQEIVTRMVIDTVSLGRMIYAKELTVTHAKSDTCGYSGVNGAIRTPSGEHAEVQINVPTVMFGKMSAEDYKACLRASDTDYASLQQKYQLPGGYGHALYEIWRTNKANPRGKEAAELSVRYYGVLRTFPNVDARETRALSADLAAFRSKTENSPFFSHAVSAAPPAATYQSDYR